MFLDEFSVSPSHVFRKPCLVALMRLAVVGLKVLQVNTGVVLVLKFVQACFLPHFMIVVAQVHFPHPVNIVSGPFDYFFSILIDRYLLFV